MTPSRRGGRRGTPNPNHPSMRRGRPTPPGAAAPGAPMPARPGMNPRALSDAQAKQRSKMKPQNPGGLTGMARPIGGMTQPSPPSGMASPRSLPAQPSPLSGMAGQLGRMGYKHGGQVTGKKFKGTF